MLTAYGRKYAQKVGRGERHDLEDIVTDVSKEAYRVRVQTNQCH